MSQKRNTKGSQIGALTKGSMTRETLIPPRKGPGMVVSIVQLASREWLAVGGLIFGGCCSNVFTLEKIVTHTPEAGLSVTFFQFLFIALEGYICYFDRNRPPFFLRENQVPLRRWLVAVVLFFAASVMNNAAFIFGISVPVHIVLRSSGTAVAMAVGWLVGGRHYNLTQVGAATLLTLGATLTALYRETEIFDAEYEGLISTDPLFLAGVGALLLAALLMAILGLYNEETYRRHGRHWRENVFYSHLLALPFFIPLAPRIESELNEMWTFPDAFNVFGIRVPKLLVYLALNILTQFFCVRGANRLASKTTALTVSVILLLRKFTSLLLSVLLFGSRLSVTGTVGACVVFGGALLYNYGSASGKEQKLKKSE